MASGRMITCSAKNRLSVAWPTVASPWMISLTARGHVGHRAGQIRANLLDGLQADLGGVDRDLVPRQQVAGEAEGQR